MSGLKVAISLLLWILSFVTTNIWEFTFAWTLKKDQLHLSGICLEKNPWKHPGPRTQKLFKKYHFQMRRMCELFAESRWNMKSHPKGDAGRYSLQGASGGYIYCHFAGLCCKTGIISNVLGKRWPLLCTWSFKPCDRCYTCQRPNQWRTPLVSEASESESIGTTWQRPLTKTPRKIFFYMESASISSKTKPLSEPCVVN